MEMLKQEQLDSEKQVTVEDTVSSIINRVRQEGDAALKAYLREFDGVEIEELRVQEEDIQKARAQLPQTLIEDIQFSVAQIQAFAEAQRRSLTEFEQEMIPGVFLGQRVIPIETVGGKLNETLH
ncbi:histidinol dehydrogenase [Bacillota bacterium Lsc_1132]